MSLTIRFLVSGVREQIKVSPKLSLHRTISSHDPSRTKRLVCFLAKSSLVSRSIALAAVRAELSGFAIR